MPAALPTEGFGLSTLPSYTMANPQFFVNDPGKGLAGLNLGLDTMQGIATFTEAIAAANAQNRLSALENTKKLDLVDSEIDTRRKQLAAEQARARLNEATASGETNLLPLRLDLQKKELDFASAKTAQDRQDLADTVKQLDSIRAMQEGGNIGGALQAMGIDLSALANGGVPRGTLNAPQAGGLGIGLGETPALQTSGLGIADMQPAEVEEATVTATGPALGIAESIAAPARSPLGIATDAAATGTLGALGIAETPRQIVERSTPRAMLELDIGKERLSRAKQETALGELELAAARELAKQGNVGIGDWIFLEQTDEETGDLISLKMNKKTGSVQRVEGLSPKERTQAFQKDVVEDDNGNPWAVWTRPVKEKDGIRVDIVPIAPAVPTTEMGARLQANKKGQPKNPTFRNFTTSITGQAATVTPVAAPVAQPNNVTPPTVTPAQQATANALGGTLDAAQKAQATQTPAPQNAGQRGAGAPIYGRLPDGSIGIIRYE